MAWLKNTGNKPDAIFTLLIIAFVVVTVEMILGLFASITLFGHVIPLQRLDSMLVTAYFGALLSAYVARRHGWGFRNQENGDDDGSECEGAGTKDDGPADAPKI